MPLGGGSVSVRGSTLLFHRGTAMTNDDDELPPFPIKPELWARVLARLHLSPQQASVAELVVRGLSDSRICFELGIRKPTVRTHLDRLFKRAKVADRVELIIRVFAIALEECEGAS